ncbi:MAG: hypothetical protein ACKOFX_07230 [Solirubrobacterales bacterium]
MRPALLALAGLLLAEWLVVAAGAIRKAREEREPGDTGSAAGTPPAAGAGAS